MPTAAKFMNSTLGPSWRIRISNQSGGPQNYALFSAPPTLTSGVKPDKFYTNAVAVADNVADKTGTADFVLPKALKATCGRLDMSDTSTPTVTVGDSRPVTLGSTTDSGQPVPGTQWSIKIVRDETPTFDTSQNASEPGAFSIKTGEFAAEDAKDYHYFIGYGSTFTDTVGPYALWVPAPGQTYQIKPTMTFYILIDDVQPKSPLTPDQISRGFPVDFDSLGRNSAVLVHNNKNKLNIQIPGADL